MSELYVEFDLAFKISGEMRPLYDAHFTYIFLAATKQL